MSLNERRSNLNQGLTISVLLLFCAMSSGCSLFVMAGKLFLGDPRVTSQFTAATGTSLLDSDKPVVIICDAPHGLLSKVPSLQIDLLDRVSRILEGQGVPVADPGDVATWYDDHGEWGDYSQIANAMDAEFVLHIHVSEFTHEVPESDTLLQGNIEGHVTVHKIASSKKDKSSGNPVSMIFSRAYGTQFPSSYPVPKETRSEDSFIQSFMDRSAIHIAQHFYDYRTSDSIE